MLLYALNSSIDFLFFLYSFRHGLSFILRVTQSQVRISPENPQERSFPSPSLPRDEFLGWWIDPFSIDDGLDIIITWIVGISLAEVFDGVVFVPEIIWQVAHSKFVFASHLGKELFAMALNMVVPCIAQGRESALANSTPVAFVSNVIYSVMVPKIFCSRSILHITSGALIGFAMHVL